MRKLATLIGLAGVAPLALAAGGWIVNGRGEFSTPQGDAYIEIRGESRGNGNAAVGGARFVIKDASDRPILSIEMPRGQGQFQFAQHNAVLQGPGTIRNANGLRHGPVSFAVHDGGPNGVDHVKVTAGERSWEGDLEEGDIVVKPRQ
jgi:hypothetical protein